MRGSAIHANNTTTSGKSAVLNRGPLYQSIQSLKSRFLQAAKDMEQSYISNPLSFIRGEDLSAPFNKTGLPFDLPETVFERSNADGKHLQNTARSTRKKNAGDTTRREKSANEQLRSDQKKSAPRTAKRQEGTGRSKRAFRASMAKNAYAEIYSRMHNHHSAATMRLGSSAGERDLVSE